MQSNKERDREINKKIWNSVINESTMLIQAILALFLIVFGIASLFVSELMPVFIIIFGLVCFVMAYNNYRIYKRKGATVIYLLAGAIGIISGILNICG